MAMHYAAIARAAGTYSYPNPSATAWCVMLPSTVLARKDDLISQGKALTTISLIGMPGSGKSTVAVILAKLAGLRFIDTDLDIQLREQDTLQNILETHGYQYLREIEQAVLMSAPLGGVVLATGGSVVYSEIAMKRLCNSGPVVYLDAELTVLEQRVAAAPPRGIASDPRATYAQVYDERTPLYRYYSDIVVSASIGGPERVAETILQQIVGT